MLTIKAVNFRTRRSFSVFSDLNKDSRQCWKCYNLVLRFWTQSALGNPPMQDRTFFAGIGLLQLKTRLKEQGIKIRWSFHRYNRKPDTTPQNAKQCSGKIRREILQEEKGWDLNLCPRQPLLPWALLPGIASTSTLTPGGTDHWPSTFIILYALRLIRAGS